METFNHRHAGEVAAAVDVWRRPYSFLGDAPGGKGHIRNGGSWHESLIDYTDGTKETAVAMQNSMNALASRNNVTFDFSVKTHW